MNTSFPTYMFYIPILEGRQKISILVELTVCQKNVANALNSVVIILNNKVLFVTFLSFFMVMLQNFLNAPRNMSQARTLFPDHLQITWLFQIFQVGGHPASTNKCRHYTGSEEHLYTTTGSTFRSTLRPTQQAFQIREQILSLHDAQD